MYFLSLGLKGLILHQLLLVCHLCRDHQLCHCSRAACLDRRDSCVETPYLGESGPEVFDRLYDSALQQALLLLSEPRPAFHMVSMETLVKDSLNVLIGVPSLSFMLDLVSTVHTHFLSWDLGNNCNVCKQSLCSTRQARKMHFNVAAR